MLSRTNDPPCPQCGCTESKPIPRQAFKVIALPDGRRERVVLQSRECSHCRCLFQVPTENREQYTPIEPPVQKVVPFVVIRCPRCNSKHTQTLKVKPWVLEKRTRYHECREPDCLFRFKSIEIREFFIR